MKLLKVILFIFSLSSVVYAGPSDLTVEDFFKNPDFTNLTLSPDAKEIAVITTVNKRRNIVLLDTATLKNARALTGFDDVNVGGFFWANPDEIVFTLDQSGGREAFSIYKVNTKGKTKVTLLVGATFGSSGVRSAGVVNTLPDDPDHIIVQYNGRRATSPDLFKLPLDSYWSTKRNKNSKMKLLAKNPGNVQGWLVDNDGNVRGAVTLDGVRGKFLYKDIGEKDFRTLQEYDVHDEGFNPLGFDFDI